MTLPRSNQNFLVVSLTILAIAAPAALSMGYYLLSGDPRIRPLALTREGEARHGVDGLEILVTLHLGRGGNTYGVNIPDMRNRIRNAFYAHGEEVRIITEDSDSQTVQISYTIGRTRIGPMEIGAAAEGVKPAIDAYRVATR